MLKYFYNLFDKMKEKLNKKGQGMVEYALILAAVAIIAGFVLSDSESGLASKIKGAFVTAGDKIEAATDVDNIKPAAGDGGDSQQPTG